MNKPNNHRESHTMNTIQGLDLLRCPHCAPTDGGHLKTLRDGWLSCSDCHRNYPVVQDIPVMLPEEGDRWINTPSDELPVIESHNRFVASAN